MPVQARRDESRLAGFHSNRRWSAGSAKIRIENGASRFHTLQRDNTVPRPYQTHNIYPLCR